MARQQFNHRLCDHPRTPAARRVCRKLAAKVQALWVAQAEREYGHLLDEQVLFYGLDHDGQLDDLRHYGMVRGFTSDQGRPLLVVWDYETYAEVTVCPSEAEHVPPTHEKYRAGL